MALYLPTVAVVEKNYSETEEELTEIITQQKIKTMKKLPEDC
jgi:hypothetical protein